MQREQRRELVAAFACAAVPAAWARLASAGWVPDVLDTDAGADVAVSIGVVRGWWTGMGEVATAGAFGDGAYWPAVPIAAIFGAIVPASALTVSRATFALAVWAAGYGAWRLARVVAPSSGWVGAAASAVAMQLGPSTLGPLFRLDLAALAPGVILLALAHPRFGVVAGLFGMPAASCVVTMAAVRRRPWMAAGAIGLLGLGIAAGTAPGAALRVEPAPAAVPAYGTEAGAWFPMPPSEAAEWKAVAAQNGGRWLHPRAQALTLGTEATEAPGKFATALEGLDREVDRILPILGQERRAIGRAAMLSPLAAVAALLMLLAMERRRWTRFLPVVAVVCGSAGLWSASAAMRAWQGSPTMSGHDLAALVDVSMRVRPGSVAIFPPPHAPYYSGRISISQWTAVLASTRREGADFADAEVGAAVMGALGRKAEYGLDVQGAERLWSARGVDEPMASAAKSEIAMLVVDMGALPAPAAGMLDGWLASRIGVPLAKSGALSVYDVVGGARFFADPNRGNAAPELQAPAVSPPTP